MSAADLEFIPFNVEIPLIDTSLMLVNVGSNVDVVNIPAPITPEFTLFFITLLSLIIICESFFSSFSYSITVPMDNSVDAFS